MTILCCLLADIAFATMMLAAQRFGATFDKFPKLKAYVETIKVGFDTCCMNNYFLSKSLYFIVLHKLKFCQCVFKH